MAPRLERAPRDRHRRVPRRPRAQVAAALHHLRQRRRRQVARSSAACSTSRSWCSRTTSPRWRRTRRRSAPRAASSTSPSWSTASPPSASRASPSTSPTGSSPPSAASSSSPTRPGHEQYTRNMVTGASTADLAVILIDARKGVLTQTRRHSYLVSLLGIRHVVLAVNKLDLVDYSQEVFDEIEADYRAFAAEIGIERHHRASRCRRCAATTSSSRAPTRPGTRARRSSGTSRRSRSTTTWHDGRSACRCSGSTARTSTSAGSPARSSAARCGPATASASLPAGRESTVARIVTFDGDLDEAVAGQSVTLTLADEIDVSRGDVAGRGRRAAAGGRPVRGPHRVDGRAGDAPRPALPAEDRHPTVVGAAIDQPKYKVNVNTLEHTAATTLRLNEIGVCNLHLDRPVPFDPYGENRDMGGFIVIDRLTNATVGAGLAALRAAPVGQRALAGHRGRPARARAAQGPASPPSCGSPASRAPASRPSPTWSSASCTPRGATRTCSTATTSATASTSDLGLHRGRPRREHPPRRRGGRAHGRRRPHRAGVVHLAVPGRAPAGPRARRRRRVLRGLRRHAARGRRGPRPQGPLREGPPRRDSPTSPASTRRTRRPNIPRCTSGRRSWPPRRRPTSSSRP